MSVEELVAEAVAVVVRLAIASLGPNRARMILDAEYEIAKRAADAIVDAEEREKFPR